MAKQMADLNDRQLELLYELATMAYHYPHLEVGNPFIIEFDHEYGEETRRELANVHFEELVCCYLRRQSAKNLAYYVCQREVTIEPDKDDAITVEDAVRINEIRERNRRKIKTTCRKFLSADDAYFDRWYAYQGIVDEKYKL